MLKHFIEKHRDKKKEEMKFSVKVLRSYRSAFERQIGESVWINHNLMKGSTLMNSKNEYNRCIIPRFEIDLGKDEAIIEYEENEREKEVKREIQKMKEKLMYDKQAQKEKRRKLADNRDERLPKKKNDEVKESKNEKEKKDSRKKVRSVKCDKTKKKKDIWGEKEVRKLRLDDIRKKIVNRVNAQNKKEITEKLSDIFGEKKDLKKMERKRKWWKRFGDEVREMVGSNDMISNVLLNQIPEKTATVEISVRKLHHHPAGSWREEIQVRNDIDIETNVETDVYIY